MVYKLIVILFLLQNVAFSEKLQINEFNHLSNNFRNISRVKYFISRENAANPIQTIDTMFYDSLGNINKIIQKEYNTETSKWDTLIIKEYGYDSLRNLIKFHNIYYYDRDSTWDIQDVELHRYKYDDKGNVIKDILYDIDSYDSTEYIIKVIDYEYSSKGELILKSTDYFRDYIRNTNEHFEYDYKGKLLKQTIEEWIEKYQLYQFKNQYFYKYDENMNCSQILEQYWYYGLWEDIYKEDMSYDSRNNNLIYTKNVWNDTSWTLCSKVINDNIYNNQSKISEKYSKYSENNEIFELHKTKYEYNDLNNLTSFTSELFKNNQWVYWNDSLDLRFNKFINRRYDCFSLQIEYDNSFIKDSIIELELLTSPTPAENELSIKFNLKESKTLSISIYSSNGAKVTDLKNEIYFEKGEYNLKYQTNILSTGSYLIVIDDGKSKQINKFIVLK